METKISTKGHVALPRSLLDKARLRPGDALDARLEGGGIVLTPKGRRRRKARIIIDPRTGLAVLTAGPGAPIPTHKQVKEVLAEFP
jgi:bifunctional DNA-binding transcriptional regulator/antitoxin component of YhaV-PrlF toxin-antitoxin module